MLKALVVQGDATTTRGFVFGASAHGMTDQGKPFALHGDEATCGICKGTFQIFGTATQRCYEGRAGVVDGDLVLCPCNRNRVIAGPDAGCFYETEDSTPLASFIQRNEVVIQAPALAYDDRFVLRDSKGLALPRTGYALKREAGDYEYGVTDDNGHTHLVTPVGSAEAIDIYLAG